MNKLMRMMLAQAGIMSPADDDGAAGGGGELDLEGVFDDLLNEGDDDASEQPGDSDTTGEQDDSTGDDPVGDAPAEVETPEGKAGEAEETDDKGEEETPEGEDEVTPPEGVTDEPEETVDEVSTGLTEEEIEVKRQEWRESLEKDFAISEDDATLLLTSPETVMPKLAANMYERVMSDVMTQMQVQIPAVIQQVKQQTDQQDALRSQFYTVNPGLEAADEKQVAELIPQYAQLVKSTNPNLTQEELIRKVGTVIGAALGVDAGKKKEQAPAQLQPEPTAQPAPAPAPAASVQTGNPGLESGQPNDFLTELIETTER